MAVEISVRPAEPADAEPVSVLMVELGYSGDARLYRDRLRDFAASPDDHVLVATAGDQVIGAVSLHFMPFFHLAGRICRLTAFVVAEGQRGRGAGRRLVAAAEDLARAHGCVRLDVTSGERPARAGAHAFYGRMGFERLATRYFVKRIG